MQPRAKSRTPMLLTDAKTAADSERRPRGAQEHDMGTSARHWGMHAAGDGRQDLSHWGGWDIQAGPGVVYPVVAPEPAPGAIVRGVVTCAAGAYGRPFIRVAGFPRAGRIAPGPVRVYGTAVAI